MARPVHFEIQADDIERAKSFYSEVFGWAYEDYTQFTGTPYFGIVTGEDDTPGINGGLMLRETPRPEPHQPLNAFVVTMLVDDYDAAMERILANGGDELKAKYALPGMAWQGYYSDPEGNAFGIHQADPDAS